MGAKSLRDALTRTGARIFAGALVLAAVLLCLSLIGNAPTQTVRISAATLLALILSLAALLWALREPSSSGAHNDVLSALTHDLRQPLQAVLLYLDALDRRTEREDARNLLAKAQKAAQALSVQLDALSLHNRLTRNEITARAETITLGDLASDALKHAPEGAVALNLAEPALEIETDPVLFAQTLRALIANALTHGGGGAKLEIAREGDALICRVRDEGPGVRVEDRARVFQPFVKLEAGGDGLGLGLSNAAQIAALLDARLAIEDAPDEEGGGAVFALTRPLRASAR